MAENSTLNEQIEQAQNELSEKEKALGLEHPEVANAFRNLAWIYKEQANYNQAESCLRRALDIWKKASVKDVLEMPDDPFQPFNARQYGNDSRSWEERYADHARRKVSRRVVEILQDLAYIYSDQKNYSQARLALENVRAIQENNYPKDNLAQTITSIAELDLGMNNFFEAEEGYKQAKMLWEQVNDFGRASNIINDLKLKLIIVDRSKDLYNTNKELKTANESLEREKQQNTNLIRSYSHTLSNTIFPRTLYDIAERIKNNQELRKDALLLQDAYHAEISIIMENELLQMRYSASKPEIFRQSVRKDRLPVTNPQAQNIENIFNYALSRVIARFLNQDYAKMNPVRSVVMERTGKTLNTMRQNFEEALFFNNPPQTAHTWCHTNLRHIELQINSPTWQQVGIKRQGLTEALLYGHFAEVIFNAFKYADHHADWFLRVAFNEQIQNDVNYLTAHFASPLQASKSPSLGNGQGLAAIEEDLRQLNSTTAATVPTLMREEADGIFNVTLHYQADLLHNIPVANIDFGALLLGKKG